MDYGMYALMTKLPKLYMINAQQVIIYSVEDYSLIRFICMNSLVLIFVGKTPNEIASFLCSEAIRKRSEDNVTVILTKIDWTNAEGEALTPSG
jgi:hypothetical protein